MCASKDWVETAKTLFTTAKPDHFTDYGHCRECAEHDATLRRCSVETIGLEELGNPGWDPITFSSAEGIAYYLPALIRLSLETIDNDNYFEQLLFHLEYGGEENRLLRTCSDEQRTFIADFIAYMILSFPEALDKHSCLQEAIEIHELWSGSGGYSQDTSGACVK